MYSENIVMIVLIAGILIGIMFTVVVMYASKTYGRWTRGLLWYKLDKQGHVICAMFEHPSTIKNIIKLRGE